MRAFRRSSLTKSKQGFIGAKTGKSFSETGNFLAPRDLASVRWD
jgi:hypothetical protein